MSSKISHTELPSSHALHSQQDIVAQINGNFGRWQLRTIVLIFLCKIPTAWFMACIIYTAPMPRKGDYFCKPPHTVNRSSNDQPKWIRMSQSENMERNTDRHFYVDACNIYEESLELKFTARYPNYSNPFRDPQRSYKESLETSAIKVNVIPCEHFEHNSEYISLVTQFDLVCSRQLLISLSQSFHAFGALIGGLIATNALKHTSPRRLMMIGMLLQIVCGNLTGIVSTFYLHVFFRCLTSIFCAFMYTAGQIILADITNGSAKTIVTTLFELFWSIGLILLPGISIFFDSWSYLYVAISSSVAVLVFLHRWISDSPRWLLRHNKIDKALQVLLESAAFNNCDIPLNLVAQLESYAKELHDKKLPNYWSIWDGKTKKRFILSTHWAWVWSTVLYNVMLLMIRQLGVKHLHVNTISLGFAEMIGVFIGLFFILYTRHRWQWTGYIMIGSGLLTYMIWLIPDTMKENRRVGMQMIFWISLKMANSSSLSVLTSCTGDMVCVEKRPILMLSVLTFSRFWLIIAPFLSTLTLVHQFLPITIFANMAICNGFLMCYLDRTFWNEAQPRIEKIPTPKTYRRNSANVLLLRSSTCSELIGSTTTQEAYENPITISISHLWTLDSRFDPIEEYNSTIDDQMKAQIENRFF